MSRSIAVAALAVSGCTLDIGALGAGRADGGRDAGRDAAADAAPADSGSDAGLDGGPGDAGSDAADADRPDGCAPGNAGTACPGMDPLLFRCCGSVCTPMNAPTSCGGCDSACSGAHDCSRGSSSWVCDCMVDAECPRGQHCTGTPRRCKCASAMECAPGQTCDVGGDCVYP